VEQKMENQEATLSTNVKVCPHCMSPNVKWLGTGRTTGVGEPMKEVDRFSFKCKVCNKIFTYTGEKP
jgi:transposase-like protein